MAVLGFRTLTRSIYEQRTCEWANIDNLELHAKVNIPKISSSDCEYNRETNTKKAYFVVKKDMLAIDKYLDANKLSFIDNRLAIQVDKLLNIEELSTESKSFYSKESHINGESSYVLFNSDEGKLWVTVEFSNEK